VAGGAILFSDPATGVVQSGPAMKSKALRFLPLAFLAGTHGFALFAPYAGLVLAALHLRGVRRRRKGSRERASRGPLPVPVPAAPAVDPDEAVAVPA
jgi:hypothetical protein